MAWGAIIGGAIGAAPSPGNYFITKDQMHQQEKYQERMSNTAYQRAMADMRRAGLNPILAYQRGPASTPGAPSGAGGGGNLGSVVSSAAEGARLQDSLENIRADTAQKRSAAKLSDAQVSLAEKQAEKVAVETLVTGERVSSAKSEAAIRQLQAEQAQNYGESAVGKFLQSLERAGTHAWTATKKWAKGLPGRKPRPKRRPKHLQKSVPVPKRPRRPKPWQPNLS